MLQEGGNQMADGDYEFAERSSEFDVCTCLECGGTLKPDVTFFGDVSELQLAQMEFDNTS